MPSLDIVTEAELRQVVKLDLEAVECVQSAFIALAEGKVVMPPILSMPIKESNGEVDVKTAYMPGLDSFAIKMSPGFFDNPKLGLPSTTGLMVLFSTKTGLLEAVLLDNGYLTDVRTAAAGAIAAKHLSRSDSERACIVGTGQQAKLQLEALCLVRPIREAVIWGRDASKASQTTDEMSTRLGISVEPTQDLPSAVSAADIVVTTTPSSTPLVMGDWLRSGQHITSMGSDQDHKNELDPSCFSMADLYVPDRRSQTEKLGELHHALVAGTAQAESKFPELGEVASGGKPGRQSDDEITICDLTGTGVQDTAIATFARKRARESGVGMTIEA